MAEQDFLIQFVLAICLLNRSEQREQLWFQFKDFLLGRGRNSVQFPDGMDFGELKNSFDDSMDRATGEHFLNEIDGHGQQVQRMFQRYCRGQNDNSGSNSSSNSAQSSISQSSSVHTSRGGRKKRRTLRKRKLSRNTRN